MANYPAYGYQPMQNFIPPLFPQQSQQQQQNIIRVTGIDGAKAYQMPPNSAAALFDGNEDVFYLKSTDGAGFPTIKAFRFEAVEQPQQTATEYVSRKEFESFRDEMRGALTDGKQSVPRKKSAAEPAE